MGGYNLWADTMTYIMLPLEPLISPAISTSPVIRLVNMFRMSVVEQANNISVPPSSQVNHNYSSVSTHFNLSYSYTYRSPSETRV